MSASKTFITALEHPDDARGLERFYRGTDGPSFRFLNALLRQPTTRAWAVLAPAPASSPPGGHNPASNAASPVGSDSVEREGSTRHPPCANATLAVIWFSIAVDEADLVDVRVTATARRQGLGRRLIKHALEALASSGVVKCHLEVRRSNTPALTLYQQLGFAITGERKNYYPVHGGFEDAILMALNLGSGSCPA